MAHIIIFVCKAKPRGVPYMELLGHVTLIDQSDNAGPLNDRVPFPASQHSFWVSLPVRTHYSLLSAKFLLCSGALLDEEVCDLS